MTSPEIEVNNEVLRWGRESIGYSIEDVAKKAGLSVNTLKEWETKTSKIRYSTLTKLAKVLVRPTTALLLDKPPVEPMPPEYFRRVGAKGPLPPEIRIAIRKARHLQHSASELERDIGVEIKATLKGASLGDNYEIIAERERNNIGVSLETQLKWKDARMALKAFRSAIEKKNIFVFQMEMPPDLAQGFSLADGACAVIVLNSKDIPERRIFTLFHEYAHLLLGKEGVCGDIDAPTDDRTEQWCDNFAGAFLAPKKALEEKVPTEGITYKEIILLSKSFSVSKYLIFVRLKVVNLISNKNYSELSGIFNEERTKAREITAKKEKTGKKVMGQPQYRRCISEKGNKFVSLVLENMGENNITTAKALDFLSVRLDNLDKVAAAVKR